MEKIFKTENQMADYLEEVFRKQEFYTCYINEMNLKALANAPIIVDALKSQMGFAATKEKILECMPSGVLITVPRNGVKTNIPVYPTALKSLCDRARLYGTTTKLFPLVLNEGFQYYQEEAQILLQEDILLAVHSKDYSYLPQNDLFNILRSGLGTTFSGYRFVEGSYSEELTTAFLEFPNQKSAIAALGCNDCTPAVLFTTNDVGKCGANLQAMLVKESVVNGVKRKVRVRLGTQLSTTHKDNHTVADFGANVDNLLSILQDGTKKLEALKNISIHYPEQCFMNIVKEYNLPRKEAESAKEDFSIRRGPHITAYDLYWALWNIMVYVKASGASMTKQMDVEENLTRSLNAAWSKFDTDYAI